MMTSSKAIAGAVASNIVTVALWGLSLIPGWTEIPDAPRSAIQALVVAAIGAGIVWFAPANARKATEGGR